MVPLAGEVMVEWTVDIPDHLLDALAESARLNGNSIRDEFVRYLEMVEVGVRERKAGRTVLDDYRLRGE